MSNLYHKITVASISIALSLTLGTDKQAKAATITLAPAQFFNTIDQNGDGRGDLYNLPSLGLKSFPAGTFSQNYPYGTTRPAYEFNIGNLSLAPNTIKSAKFNAIIRSLRISPGDPVYVSLYGYTGNGQADASDFEAGERFPLVSERLYSGDYRTPTFNISWDVAPFIKRLLSNNTSAFAGLRVHGDRLSVEGVVSDSADPSHPYSVWYPTLEIKTEPVPEPTTIFGSALALSLGGWLKRKKSSQHNKTTP
jgi:hypothetical protein